MLLPTAGFSTHGQRQNTAGVGTSLHPCECWLLLVGHVVCRMKLPALKAALAAAERVCVCVRA